MNPAGYLVLLLCGPLAAVAAVWVAERVGVPYPVLLVAVGALLSWLPWVSVPQLSPEVVFYVFLPPLLYYAANFIAPEDLRANARPIGLLAVGLVVVTTAAVRPGIAWSRRCATGGGCDSRSGCGAHRCGGGHLRLQAAGRA